MDDLAQQMIARRNTRLARKLAELLEAEGYSFPGGPENASICRTRAGYWQLSAGAWRWTLQPIEGDLAGHDIVGGYDTATETARAKDIRVYMSHHGDLNMEIDV